MAKRGEWHAEARRLAAQGMRPAQIALALDRSPSAVSKALNPERAREYWMRENNKPGRNAQKRAIDNAHRSACINCGGLLAPASEWRGYKRCKDCHLIHQRAAHRERDLQIVAWWAEGLTMREICARLGWSKGHLSCEIHRLRARGYSLPHRRSPEGLANIRAGIHRAKVAA